MKTRRKHDIGQWGNSNFSQNTSSREYDRVNSNFDYTEQRLNDEPVRSDYRRYDYVQPTWGRTNNEAYVWEDDGRQEHHLHRGKGPKGYRRSDERILEDIHDRLTFDNFLDASNIEVSVENGEVTLTGTVSERRDKRRAEDITESVSGVQHLENRIRVKRDDSDDYPVSNGNGKHYKTLIKSH